MNAIAQPTATPTSGPQLDNRRVLAGLIDLLVVLAPAFLIGFAAGMSGAESQPGLALSAVMTAWALYYYFALESGGGQTLGKKVMKLRVVRVDGAPLQMGDVAVRTVLRIVDGMFLYLVGLVVMLATGKRRARLGDLAAKTMVVSANGPPVAPSAPVPVAAVPVTTPLVAPEAPAGAVTGSAGPPAVPELRPFEPPAPAEPAMPLEPPAPAEPAAVVEPEQGAVTEPETPVESAPVVEPEPIVVTEPIVGPEPVAGPEPIVEPEPIAVTEPEPVVVTEPVAGDEPVVAPVFPFERPAEPQPLEPAPLPPAAEQLPIDRPVPVKPAADEQPPAYDGEQPPSDDDEPRVVVKSVDTVSAIDLVMGVDEPAAEDASQDPPSELR